jgi:hypothetical protein
LFENAADPDKIVVGLVEQNEPEDKFCLEVYCATFGAFAISRSLFDPYLLLLSLLLLQ